ncbi:MAG: hypothetical protein WC707_00180 [Candidatus Babeliaceae bacterium]|jgi:hypothetical protein
MNKKLLLGMLLACPHIALPVEQRIDSTIKQLSEKLEQKIKYNIQKKYYSFGALLTNAQLPDQERITKTMLILQQEALGNPEQLDKYAQLTKQEQDACIDVISKIIIVFCATKDFAETIDNNNNIAGYMTEYARLKKDIAPSNTDLHNLYKKLIE